MEIKPNHINTSTTQIDEIPKFQEIENPIVSTRQGTHRAEVAKFRKSSRDVKCFITYNEKAEINI